MLLNVKKVFSIVTKCYILNNSWRRMEYIPYKRSLYNKEMKIQEEHHVRLRASRNKLSKQIGALMGQGKKEEAEEVKKQVSANSARLTELEAKEAELSEKILKIMMTIPNIIDSSVPIGKDDSQNVEIERFGEPVVPDFEIPYHTDIMESFNGIDLDAARRVAGKRFHDQPWIYLLRTSFHDPQQRSNRRYELC